MIGDDEIRRLKIKARDLRVATLDAFGHLGVGHIGGALSVIEVLTILYYRHMKIDPGQPRLAERDKLVLSKGHAGPALYSVLADKGFFPKEWLHTLNRGGTSLPSHCDMRRTPGIDMTTGSLGQGMSAAIGLTLGNRLNGSPGKVYMIIGDGESNEGQIWEGAMCAAHYRLRDLIGFMDYNHMQIDGYCRDIMNIDVPEEKWAAFGWFAQRVDGHDFAALDRAIERAKQEDVRPSMIVMDTVKGKGAFFAENNVGNHNMKVDEAMAAEAIRRLMEEVL
ncbi:MAG TPA: transketolase [Verrucomicrobiae bacterium]|nr:transketolase [Verrucomicrobiae bacterium]